MGPKGLENARPFGAACTTDRLPSKWQSIDKENIYIKKEHADNSQTTNFD